HPRLPTRASPPTILPAGLTRRPAREPLRLRRWRRMAHGSRPWAAPVVVEILHQARSCRPGLDGMECIYPSSEPPHPLVIAGLVPAIHVSASAEPSMDHRDKPGDDGGGTL